MYWFDVGVTILLILGGVWSFFRGLVREVVSLVGFIAACVLAIRGYPYVAEILDTLIVTVWLRQAVGFAVIFLAVMVVSVIGGRFLHLAISAAGLSLLDRLLGAGFGVAKIILVVSILIIVGGKLFPPLTTQVVTTSALGPFFARTADLVANFLEKHDYEAFQRLYKQATEPFPRLPGAPPPQPSKPVPPTERPASPPAGPVPAPRSEALQRIS